MSVDSIADFLTIIRNGVMVAKPSVIVPYSVLKYEIARILKEEGFIRDFAVMEEHGKKSLKVHLKYVDGESVIHEIKRVSKPSRRVYKNIANLDRVIGGLGIAILSTSRGVITDKQARARHVGGELICEIW